LQCPPPKEISRRHHPGSNELLFLALDFTVIVADHAMAPAFLLRPVNVFKAAQAPAVIVKPQLGDPIRMGAQSPSSSVTKN